VAFWLSLEIRQLGEGIKGSNKQKQSLWEAVDTQKNRMGLGFILLEYGNHMENDVGESSCECVNCFPLICKVETLCADCSAEHI
jgi:hypothetical protein